MELLRLSDCQIEWVAREWAALDEIAEGSFFVSWTWVGAWLASLEDLSTLYLIRLMQADRTVALGILGRAPRSGLRRMSARSIRLNESGTPSEDRITIEHNGLLIREGLHAAVWFALLDHLRRKRRLWQEFRVSGVSQAEQIAALADVTARLGLMRRIRDRSPYYWVDLDEVRQNENGYLGCLSSNTRYQLRRASKRYARSGDLVVTEAAELDEAFGVFKAMKLLHQAYWEEKGSAGAFANGFTRRFHRELIGRGLVSKQIQLLTVTAGDEPIGYLYNFVYGSRVMSYQSGFAYQGDAKRKPGLVCHSRAIEHNSRIGNSVYDFLMGDSQYKRSLSTRAGEMVWIDIRRPLLRFKFEDHLRCIKAKVKAARADGDPDLRSVEQ
ncbi:MAG: GNAT family N-acetyltransferase [Thiohalocapsa sp.]